MSSDTAWDAMIDASYGNSAHYSALNEDFEDLDDVMKLEEHASAVNSGQRKGPLRDKRYCCYDVQQALNSKLIPENFAD